MTPPPDPNSHWFYVVKACTHLSDLFLLISVHNWKLFQPHNLNMDRYNGIIIWAPVRALLHCLSCPSLLGALQSYLRGSAGDHSVAGTTLWMIRGGGACFARGRGTKKRATRVLERVLLCGRRGHHWRRWSNSSNSKPRASSTLEQHFKGDEERRCCQRTHHAPFRVVLVEGSKHPPTRSPKHSIQYWKSESRWGGTK